MVHSSCCTMIDLVSILLGKLKTTVIKTNQEYQLLLIVYGLQSMSVNDRIIKSQPSSITLLATYIGQEQLETGCNSGWGHALVTVNRVVGCQHASAASM